MANNGATRAPLVMANDSSPSYNWFGSLDYSWFTSSGSLATVPFFNKTPEQLFQIADNATAGRQLRLTFGPRDCLMADGGFNCTEACSNPSLLFEPENFRACTTLAGAALYVQDQAYSVDRTDAETAAVMAAWKVPDLATFNATGLLGDVGDCISESCTIKGKLGECPDELDTLEGVKITTANLGSVASQMTLYCNDLNVDLNNDIAGPGVSSEIRIRASKPPTDERLSASGHTVLLPPSRPGIFLVPPPQSHHYLCPAA